MKCEENEKVCGIDPESAICWDIKLQCPITNEIKVINENDPVPLDYEALEMKEGKKLIFT